MKRILHLMMRGGYVCARCLVVRVLRVVLHLGVLVLLVLRLGVVLLVLVLLFVLHLLLLVLLVLRLGVVLLVLLLLLVLHLLLLLLQLLHLPLPTLLIDVSTHACLHPPPLNNHVGPHRDRRSARTQTRRRRLWGCRLYCTSN
jgi:hypothetical protein